jgi:hypothetical protein
MANRRRIPMDQIEEAMGEGSCGFCLACGEMAYSVEPDAREYECESCGEKEVFGAEEIVLMGMVEGI